MINKAKLRLTLMIMATEADTGLTTQKAVDASVVFPIEE
jgi:hypothetical protein